LHLVRDPSTRGSPADRGCDRQPLQDAQARAALEQAVDRINAAQDRVGYRVTEAPPAAGALGRAGQEVFVCG
jgi:hypothetical protein